MIKIPEHTNCRNCGLCCGPLIVTKKEIKSISIYIKNNLSRKFILKIKKQKKDNMTCQFRDIKEKNCIIYPARPEICKLFGIIKRLECPFGNSANLDGSLLESNFHEDYYPIPKFL